MCSRNAPAEFFTIHLTELRHSLHSPPAGGILPDAVEQLFARGAALYLERRTVFGGKIQQQQTLKVEHAVKLFERVFGIQPHVNRFQQPEFPLRKKSGSADNRWAVAISRWK